MTDAGLVQRRSGSSCDKIVRRHQDRLAIVYVRQSTAQQVERHQESTRLQYALADRAAQFGWLREQIVVIDDDLGRSGASVEGRLGFQRLVAEVWLGNVGLVLGVEMSRLARSCRDWHQLLEICALFDTLIADADGVYDPANYNDRLLLGLKGTMSEAELHILKARMLAGRKAKARRGELGKPVPIGYARRPSGEVVLDPDEQAQATVRLIFDLFDRFRTVGKVMTYLVEHDIRMPVRRREGAGKGELEWRRVSRPTLLNLFANPIYAGVYAYGVRAVEKRKQKPGRRNGTPAAARRRGRGLPARPAARHHHLRALRAQPGAAEGQQGGGRRDGAGRKRASLGRADLRPLRPAHAGAIQQQRPCRPLRLLADAELLRRAVLPVAEGCAARRAGVGPRPAGAGACRDRGEPGARRQPRGRARGARAPLATAARARRLRGRARPPAICRRGAREPAGATGRRP